MKPLIQRKTRFNFFDALISVVLLLAVIALVLYLIPEKGQEKEVLLTIVANDVHADLVPLLHEGDLVFDESGNRTLGKVTKLASEQDPKNAESFTLTISLACDATFRDGAVHIAGVTFSENTPLPIRTANLFLDGVCTVISVQGD